LSVGAARLGGTAAALRRLADSHQAPRFSIADLIAALDDQGFGLLIFALALPNAVPGPFIPGFSLPFAIGIAALALQLALGLHRPRLPRWATALSMDAERFRRIVERIEPWLIRLERWLRPRPSPLTAAIGERLVGVVLISLSAVLALPIPLGNTPMALSIMLIALGLLEGDGLALMLGLPVGVVAVLYNGVLVFAGTRLFEAATHLR
jgi:hypothetical protein